MALFFDQDWFNARLAERGLTRTVLAAAAGISEADLVLVWKDQRELSAREVADIVLAGDDCKRHERNRQEHETHAELQKQDGPDFPAECESDDREAQIRKIGALFQEHFEANSAE